jgi:hypothetical protein
LLRAHPSGHKLKGCSGAPVNNTGFVWWHDETSHNEEDDMMKTVFATARVNAGACTVGVALGLRPRQ